MAVITEERWKLAQQGEAAYWAGSGRNRGQVLYELAEHCGFILPRLKPILAGKHDLHAVEIGVGGLGIGFLAAQANEHCSRIAGVEPLPVEPIELEDKALHAYARELQSRVEVVRAKGEALPFGDESFDLACCINVLDHTHDPYDVLAEVRRVTRRTGLFILAVHTRSTLVRLKWRITSALGMESEQQAKHPHTFSWSKLNRRLKKCGWKVVSQSRHSFLRRLFGFATLSVWILAKA